MVENFLDYDRITDTLMFFDRYTTLCFMVNLTKKNSKNNKYYHYHSEASYYNSYLEKQSHSIKRNVDCCFVINDTRDYNNNFIIRPQDIMMLRLLLQNVVIPWYIGNKKVFSFDNNGIMILRGKYNRAEFPISEYSYMNFDPIVLQYDNNQYKEGIRITINQADNYHDIDITKFMEFYYYIMNTDMYNAAIGLMQYIKTKPYNMNSYEVNNEGVNKSVEKPEGRKGFFDK